MFIYEALSLLIFFDLRFVLGCAKDSVIIVSDKRSVFCVTIVFNETVPAKQPNLLWKIGWSFIEVVSLTGFRLNPHFHLPDIWLRYHSETWKTPSKPLKICPCGHMSFPRINTYWIIQLYLIDRHWITLYNMYFVIAF